MEEVPRIDASSFHVRKKTWCSNSAAVSSSSTQDGCFAASTRPPPNLPWSGVIRVHGHLRLFW